MNVAEILRRDGAILRDVVHRDGSSRDVFYRDCFHFDGNCSAVLSLRL
jgi:hypothetical protein